MVSKFSNVIYQLNYWFDQLDKRFAQNISNIFQHGKFWIYDNKIFIAEKHDNGANF